MCGIHKKLYKNKIREGNLGEKQYLWGQLTSVKDMLRKVKRRPFYPLISSLGVKMAVNIVNNTKSPLYFQSRREISSILGCNNRGFVNNKNTLRRGLGSQC